MRILHLVHTFPPESWGGTERSVLALSRAQQSSGHDVHVLAGSDRRVDDAPASKESETIAREVVEGISVTRLFRTPEEGFGVLFRPDRVQRQIVSEVEEWRPDVVHLHHWFQLGDGVLAALPNRLVAVATLHDGYSLCPRFFLVRPDGARCHDLVPVPRTRCVECVRQDDGDAELDARLQSRHQGFEAEFRRVDHLFAPSQSQAEMFVRAGVRNWNSEVGEVEVVPLGIEPMGERPSHRPAPGRLRIASFGHLSRLKGIDFLLEAVRAVPPEPRRRIGLELFGAFVPGQAEELRAAAESLPVRFHGAYTLADLRRRAADLDLAVFPSRAEETYSLVVEEAVALGLPVLTSDRGAMPERVRDAGWSLAVDDVQAWTDRFVEFLREPNLLEEKRRSLRAPATVAEHARRVVARYQEVRERRARRSR